MKTRTYRKGYIVWVGAMWRWFRTQEGAEKFLAVAQYYGGPVDTSICERYSDGVTVRLADRY